MSFIDLKVFYSKLERLKNEWNKQELILSSGLNTFAPILKYFFPIILTLIF